MKPTTSQLTQDATDQGVLRHSLHVQWLVLCLVLGLLAGVMAFQRYSDYKNVTTQEQQRLQTQARVIASNVERQLEAANLALSSILKDLDYLQQHKDLHLANRRLTVLTDAMPGIRTMLVLDAAGVVTASNREKIIGVPSHTRDYFTAPQRGADPSTLYLSAPFKTVLGNYLFSVSRAITDADGSFQGVVSAAIDPAYFQALLSSVLYAPDMASEVIDGDGTRFMQVPELFGTAGDNVAVAGSGYSRHLQGNRHETVFNLAPAGTAEERIVALLQVQMQRLTMDRPLYVSCSRDRAAVYANWRSNTSRQAWIFALICLFSGACLIPLQRRQRGLVAQATQAQEVINLRLRLMEYAATHDIQELLQETVDEVCRLNNSPIGFFHFVASDQQTLSLQAWSPCTPPEPGLDAGPAHHAPLAADSLWVDCLRQQRPVIHNSAAALPPREGLPPMLRELMVPISRNKRVMAILGVGNKPTPYNQQDLAFTNHLADIVWEIIERKQREEERLKLAARYQNLLSISRDGIHILDIQGNLVESNAAFRQMLGYPADQELRLNVTDWDVAISPEQLLKDIRDMIKTPAVIETKHQRCDGTVFDVEISTCGVQLDGQWYLYASSRDISERKEMESSLRQSRQLQADIFDFLPDATFVVDQEKKVIAWNKAMEALTGLPKDAILGQGDHAYMIPFYGDPRGGLIDLLDQNDEALQATYHDVVRLGDRLFAEAFCPGLNGGKGAHIWAVVAALYDSAGNRLGAIETIRDITSIKETEANLARSNRDLEQFAYVASHDLQEPLRKIAGFTELLANRYQGRLDEKADSYMAHIVDGAKRMRNLINDLLSYARITREERTLALTDCGAVVERVLRDMDLAIREANAEIDCAPLPTLLADPTQLGQLFQNLIGNAIKYRSTLPPKIAIHATLQDSAWLFSVADNGIGIAPEFYGRIFALFQRLHTRAEHPGTGIGLALCQKLVERHGGKIWVESTVGAGSTFYFTLPSTPTPKEMTA